MDENTRMRLQDAVERAWEAGASRDEITEEVEYTLDMLAEEDA